MGLLMRFDRRGGDSRRDSASRSETCTLSADCLSHRNRRSEEPVTSQRINPRNQQTRSQRPSLLCGAEYADGRHC